MPDPLAAWRPEFPILETCTYLVNHSLGAMPRRARTYLQQFADEWSTRGVRAWHEGWWEIGRTTGDHLSRLWAQHRNDLHAPERHGRAGDCGLCHRLTAPGADRHERSRVPVNILVRRMPPHGADVSYVHPRRIRTNLDRFLEAIDEGDGALPRWLPRAVRREPVAIVEKAHRVGARVILDVSGSRRCTGS
jgi:kynureninase